MALVEIITDNLYAGANLRKLEVGAIVEVDDATAARGKRPVKRKTLTRRRVKSSSASQYQQHHSLAI
ncbi:hypothetical protein M8R78_13385 [Enterobacter hormaechei]|nr:hypothetical protein [Enterobacter hormaechei]